MKNDAREIIEFSSFSGISITYENAPSEFPAHWHSEAEFATVRKDHCRYKIGDMELEAMKGDIVLIWPRELHEIISIPNNGTIFIQFSPSLLDNNLDLVSISRLITQCHLIKAKKEPELAAAITEKIRKIETIYRNHEPFGETKCKIATYEIVLLIGEYVIRERSELIGKDAVADQAWSYIRRICSYIAEHSSEDITESEVAASVGLSTHYFSRLFKKYLQMSFPTYLSAVRVKTAIRLLADENLSITDCAFQSGFQSTTTFNRVFHDVTGYSPREYRKMHIYGV